MKTKIFAVAFLGVFLLCRVAMVYADGFECKSKISANRYQDIIDGVEYEYDGIKEFYAQFYQKSYLLGLDRTEVSKGEVYFKKPGKMKWSYSEPEKQLFVADGNQVWFYQPALKQVTLGDFAASFRSDMPVSFLMGIGDIREQFFIDSMCETDQGIKISLKPKQDDGSMGSFRLLVRQKSFATIGAQISDYGGNETTIGFLNFDREKKMADSEFVFSVPKGVDVVDYRAKPGTGGSGAKSGAMKEEEMFAPVPREKPTKEEQKRTSAAKAQGND